MINRMSQRIEVQSQTKYCRRNVNQVSGPTRFKSFRIIWRRVGIYFFRCILFEYVNTSVICTSPSISTSNCVDSENKKIFYHLRDSLLNIKSFCCSRKFIAYKIYLSPRPTFTSLSSPSIFGFPR